MADRQTHAHAVGLCRVKWLEQMWPLLRSYPWARVPHRNAHFLSVVLGADMKCAFTFDLAHCLDGVDDQVDHYLLQLDSVSSNPRQVVRQLYLHHDAVLGRFSPGKGNHLKDRFIDIKCILAWRGLPYKTLDAADHVIGSIGVFDDAFDRPCCFLDFGRRFCEPPQCSISTHSDRSKRLPDFMCYGRGELPHRCDAIGVCQLRLDLAVAALAVACF